MGHRTADVAYSRRGELAVHSEDAPVNLVDMNVAANAELFTLPLIRAECLC